MSCVNLFSAERADRKREIASLAAALGLSAALLYLLLFFWAMVSAICQRLLEDAALRTGSLALSILPVALVGVFLSIMLAVLFGALLQERHRRHRRSIG